jgi:hypothetical protein
LADSLCAAKSPLPAKADGVMLFSWPTAAIFEVLRRALEHGRK